MQTLRQLRIKMRTISICELIDEIFDATGLDAVYHAMDGGDGRLENLNAFYQLALNYEQHGQQDIARFLDYLAMRDQKGVSVSTDSADPDCVHIMTIHASKGLEFPVVILANLSVQFNTNDLYAPVICHKELGIGMDIVDNVNRTKSASPAKLAVRSRCLQDMVSESMRLLYVAMTRAKERLIMYYSAKDVDSQLADICYMDNLVNYAILVTIFHCGDNVMKNSYASVRNVTKEKRILFTPWDLDSSFGRVHNGKSHIDDPRLWAFGYQCPGMCALYNRLLCQKYKPHHWFKKMFRDRWNELRAGVLSDDSVRARLVQYADLFTSSGAWAREAERWTTLDEDEKGKDIHVPLGSIYDEVDYMMEFYTKNCAVFEEFIKDWPVSPTAVDEVAADAATVVVDGNVVCIDAGDEDAELSIFDASGCCVHRFNGARASVELNTGVYLLRLRSAKGSVVRKFVVR